MEEDSRAVAISRGKKSSKSLPTNKALIQRVPLTFWLDESTIQAGYEEPKTSSRGHPQRYSELAISTVRMFKRIFRLTLRAAQGFIAAVGRRYAREYLC